MFSIPKTEPVITKEFLLSKNSEETYMSTYLKVPVKKGLIVSPLRNDHKPTASFYRNRKGELIFHDFGTSFYGNFISVVMYINNCSYQKALRIIAEDFGYVDKNTNRTPIEVKVSYEKIDKKSDTIIEIEVKPFSDNELKWWKSFGITENTLKKFNVFSCNSVFLNGNYFSSSTSRNMAFGYYGGIRNGMQLWRIYYPQKRIYRFISNWSKNLIQGIKQLPKINDYVILVKSLKDVMCLYEQGIYSCAPCSENILISNNQMTRLKQIYNNIFVFWDNDEPGRNGSLKYKEKYPYVKCIELKPEIAKDFSDSYKVLNKVKFEEEVNELKYIISDKENNEYKYFNIL